MYLNAVFTTRFLFLCAAGILLLLMLFSGCASKEINPAATGSNPSGSSTAQSSSSKEAAKAASAAKMEELDNRVIGSPMMVTSDYFREVNAQGGSGNSIKLFGDSKREKELEERLEALESRLMGLPQRAKGVNGMPVLRRKVVMLSLLGDMGLDVLSLLPAALRRTDGLVPVDASYLSELLKSRGYSESDLLKASVRRDIAVFAGIHAYVLVYFPQSNLPAFAKTDLRIDVFHATEPLLIASFLTNVKEFDSVATKISDDVVRATEWSCRIVKVEGDRVFLNAGRLTGLQPGDRLRVFARGKEVSDPITGRSLGFATGDMKGEVVIDNLFSVDASEAKIVSGTGMETGDTVKMAALS